MARTTVEDVRSLPYRVLEWTMVGPPVLAGVVLVALPVLFLVGASGILGAETFGTLLLGGAAIGYVGVIIAGLLLNLGMPILLYLDASKLDGRGLDWEPNPVLYAVFGLLFGGLTALHYLYKRHQVVVDWEGRELWWAVGTGSLALAVALGVLGVVVPDVAALQLLQFAAFGLVVGLVPLSFYKDSMYVRLNSGDWQPNPINHYVIVLFSIVFAFVPVIVYLAYYLFRRHRALGTP